MIDKNSGEIKSFYSRVANEENEAEYDENLVTCHYYDVNEFATCRFNSNRNFSMLHLNIHSIQAHIEELEHLLNLLDHKFDIIAISESKLKDSPVVNIDIPGYNPPHCTNTESEKGGDFNIRSRRH